MDALWSDKSICCSALDILSDEGMSAYRSLRRDGPVGYAAILSRRTVSQVVRHGCERRRVGHGASLLPALRLRPHSSLEASSACLKRPFQVGLRQPWWLSPPLHIQVARMVRRTSGTSCFAGTGLYVTDGTATVWAKVKNAVYSNAKDAPTTSPVVRSRGTSESIRTPDLMLR